MYVNVDGYMHVLLCAYASVCVCVCESVSVCACFHESVYLCIIQTRPISVALFTVCSKLMRMSGCGRSVQKTLSLVDVLSSGRSV